MVRHLSVADTVLLAKELFLRFFHLSILPLNIYKLTISFKGLELYSYYEEVMYTVSVDSPSIGINDTQGLSRCSNTSTL